MADRNLVRKIFGEALGQPVRGRAAFVAAACVGDVALHGEVESLLAAHDTAQDFLGAPTVDSPRGLLPDAAPGENAGAEVLDQARVGTRIGRYKLLECLGEGGFGTVYMAEQEEPFQRRVALKIVKFGMDTKATLARFDAERQALAMMDHPNIARVFDAGSTETGRPYFVMELVRGVPITHYCDTNNLSMRQRLELFMPVCRAVQHAHQKGIIHRDMKPSNVLVTMHDGVAVPKVIDFGIAKAMNARLTDKTLFTEFRQFIGTPEYMSPEQAEMSGLDIDTRADIYALGVLLYELLTGTTPFDGKELRQAAMGEIQRIIREVEPLKPSARLSTLGETLAAVAAHRHTDSQKLGQLVRGELDWIVMKCLEKDRTRRYETASGLAMDVERFLKDEAVEASPPSKVYLFRKFARRNKAPLMTAALLAIVMMVGSAISVWQALRALRAEGLAQTRFEAEKNARGRAVTEAAKATAISALLQEALESADPDHVKGAQYTVRQLLDDLSGRLGDQLSDQPLAEAAVQRTIGNTYRGLGLPQQAQPHLNKAMQLRLRLLGPQDHDYAQSLLDYAYNSFESRQFAAAEAETRQALAIFQTANTKDERALRAYTLLMLLLKEQRKDSEAQAVADQAVRFAAEAGFPEHAELAKILHNLVQLKLNAGDAAGAEELGIKAVAMQRRVNGNDHPETGWALLHLGQALEQRGKVAEAESTLREALLIFRKHYEESHKSITMVFAALQRVLTAKGDKAALAALSAERAERMSKGIDNQMNLLDVRMLLANVMRDTGNLEGAQTNLTAAVELAKPMAAEVRDRLAAQCGQMARLMQDKRMLRESELCFRQAILLREPLGAERPSALKLLQSSDYNDLAYVLVAEKRMPEAEGSVRSSLELKLALVRDFPENVDYRMHVVHAYFGIDSIAEASGRTSEALQALAEAENWLNQVAAVAPRSEGARIFLGHTLRALGGAWQRMNQWARAQDADEKSLQTFAQLAADYPADRQYRLQQAFGHRILGFVAVSRGHADEAESHFLAGFTFSRGLSLEDPDSTEYAQEMAFTARALADALVRARRYDQAESLLLAQFVELPAQPAEWQATHWREVLLRILTLYREWGQNEKLEQWRAKALEAVKRAMVQSPRDLQLQIVCGHLLRDAGDFPQSLAQFSKVLAATPQLAEAWNGRGLTYLFDHQLEKAIADFTKAMELAPDVHSNWYHRGLAYMDLAQWERASADITRVVEQWGYEPGGWYLRAVIYAQLGRPDDALADLRQAVTRGYRDAAQLKSDGRLAPLRGRDDFAKLVADLEQAAK